MTVEAIIKPGTLTIDERGRLDAYERAIDAGLASFLEVGEALAAIRKEKLYRESHEGFDAYCRDRWKFSKVQASRLITACDVVKQLPAGNAKKIPSERAARELAKVPPPKRIAVVEAAARSGKVTAPVIRQAAAQIGSKNGPPPKAEKPEPLIDGTGREVTDPLVIEALRGAGMIDELRLRAHKLRRDVAKRRKETIGKELRQRIETDLQNVATAIRFAVPYTTCPYAPNCKRGCELCGGAHWVTKEQLERIPDEDLQAAGIPPKEQWK